VGAEEKIRKGSRINGFRRYDHETIDRNALGLAVLVTGGLLIFAGFFLVAPLAPIWLLWVSGGAVLVLAIINGFVPEKRGRIAPGVPVPAPEIDALGVVDCELGHTPWKNY
jgi:hypothetical protein